MTRAIVVKRSGAPVVLAAGSALLTSMTAQAKRSRDTAESAAQAALAAAGVGEAEDTADGLANTAIGETFWVDQGDGRGRVYRHDSGPVATGLQYFIIDPAAAGAADVIGAVGGSVQELLTGQAGSIGALEETTKVDDTNNRVRVGSNVGQFHITGSGRTQAGADLNGSLFVAEGADIATGADNDATASNAFGSAIWNFTGAKIYGCDAFGFRPQSVLEDGLYVSSFAIDALKDITYGRNSNALAVKAGLYVEDIRSSTLLSVLAGAGGGALENVVIGGLNACDYYGSTSRATLKDVVVFGVNTGRGMEGDLDSVIIGNSSVQALSVTGTQNVVLAHAGAQALTTASFTLAAGYGSASTITTENNTTSIGALADAKFAGSTAIGVSAVTTGINQLQLGATGTTSYAFGAVQDRSDRRDKVDIQDIALGLEFLREVQWRQFRRNERERYLEPDIKKEVVQEDFVDEQLVPTALKDRRGRRVYKTKKIEGVRDVVKTTVTKTTNLKAYRKAEKAGKRFHLGVIAQELEATCQKLGVDFAGLQHHARNGGEDVYSVGYQEFIPVIGRAVQECDARLSAIEARLKAAGL